MSGVVRSIAEHYSLHTVSGVWITVLSFIAGIVMVALFVRLAFPIKPTPLNRQESIATDTVSEEV